MISLAEGDFPLLVDQPEDAFHAPWIEGYIVSTLRSRRGMRQCVFGTRSANVLVSSDAEQVLALKAHANRGQVEKTGSIDRFDTRDLVLFHVEGGKDAFRRRQDKYGLDILANAGLLLTATLAGRLGVEALVNEMVDLGPRPGAARPGRKVMTLVHSIVAGGDCIDDADVLRSGATGAVLSHRVMAPSTLGTFLRSFTFGHVRQLDKVAGTVLARAWAGGAGPGKDAMTIDLDSTVCEVHGYHKQGAAYGYTRALGLHPLLATRAATGEVLHARQRKGSANTARGSVRFPSELVARIRRAGATGALTVRADSGFWSERFIGTCRRLSVSFSLTVRQIPQVKEAIARIPEGRWRPIDYTERGEAQIAETTYKGDRLIVRRTRLIGPQAELWPDWRHHAFVTDRMGDPAALDEDHRRHAVTELAIRDLKEGAGMNHCPSGRFFANAAWLVLAALAHNLVRWTCSIGLGIDGPVVAKTIRRRFVAVPGRLTSSARRWRLHLPAGWPWRDAFLLAVHRLRALPLLA